MRLFFLTLTLMTVSVFANSELETSALETLTVTAHRLAVPDSPLKVKSLNTNRLTHPNWVGADVLRQFPTLAISQSGALGSLTQVRARGSEANHILVMLDGMPLNDPANGSEYNFSSLSTTGLSGIHYLSSPASSTWGSDAIGGVINLTSKPTHEVTQVEVTGGSFSTFGVRGDLSRIGERGYFRVSADTFATNGTNTASHGEETEAFASTTTHIEGGLQGPNWTIAGRYRRADIEADFDPTPFPNFTPVDGPGEVDHESELFDVKLTHTDFDDQLHTELRFGLLNTENASTSGTSSSGERQLVRLDNQWRITNQQHLLLGLDFERQEFSQRGTPSFFGNPNQNQSEDRTGLSIGYTASFGPVNVDLSLRRDNNEAFDDDTTYRAAMKYNINDTLTIRAASATGNKNPSFIERFGFTPDTFIGNPNLTPEKNLHYSVGVDFSLGVWSFSGEYFQDKLQDEINGFSFDLGSGGFTAVNQEGKSERDGVDFSVTTQFSNWFFNFHYARLNAEQSDGSTEIRRPENQMGFSVDTRWWQDRIAFHMDANFVDEQDDFNFATFPAERVALDSYFLVNAGLSVSVTDKIAFKVQIDNLTNEDYSDVFGYNNPGIRYLANLSFDW